MKNIYFTLIIVSILCMTGDNDSFIAFLIWHAVWFAVLLFSIHQLDRLEERA